MTGKTNCKTWHELKFSNKDETIDKKCRVGAEVILLPMGHDLIFNLDGTKYHITRFVEK